VSDDATSALATLEEEGLSLAVEPLALPASRNPARVYLASLPSAASRASMTSSLRTAAAILAPTLPWEDVPWHRLRVEHAAALRTRILALHPTPATSGRLLAALRGVFKASWRLRHITEDERARAADALQAAKGSRVVGGRYLGAAEVKRLFEAASVEGGSLIGLRNRAMLVLLFVGGLRRAEAASVQMAGLDRSKFTVRLIGKGNKERIVPLSEPTFVHIDAWCAVRGAEPGAVLAGFAPKGNLRLPLQPLTPEGVYKALKTLGSRCGVAVSPHDARRTRITDLLLGGLDPLGTQRFAGHANLATTELYDLRPAQRLADDVARIGSSLDPLPETP
jgi:site-specific recombinase XerD